MTTELSTKAIPISAGMSQSQSPFHAGEQRVQERIGVRDIENWARKVVRPYLPEEHRAFHTAMPFLVVAARDEQGTTVGDPAGRPRGVRDFAGPRFSGDRCDAGFG